ncbi:hypothetical protein N7453_004336, partial [Penicillium expansum]
ELLVFEKKINYNFANRALLREALQGSNALNGDGNKTLALIGVRVLGLVIVASGWNKNKTRKGISAMIDERAGTGNLHDQGFERGIDKFIVKNPCQSQIGRNVMIDTMQAIVGAVYLDCNEQIPPCADVMTALGLSWPE